MWTFVRRIVTEWASGVTGNLSAVLFVIGLIFGVLSLFGVTASLYPIVNLISEIAPWVLAVACILQAAYGAWKKENTLVTELQEKIRPKITLTFDLQSADCVIRTVIRTRARKTTSTSTSSIHSIMLPTPLNTTLVPMGPSAIVDYNEGIRCVYYRLRVETDAIIDVDNCRGHLVNVERWKNDRYIRIFGGYSLDLTFAPAERDDTLSKTQLGTGFQST